MPDPKRQKITEYTDVEKPFLDELALLGWTVIDGEVAGTKFYPENSLRENFQQVVIEQELEEALLRINPWLEPDQLEEVKRQVVHPEGKSLQEKNDFLHQIWRESSSVSENRQTGEKSPNVKLIDFANPEKNSFLAISQYQLKVPGQQKHIIPDIVLFINGMPVVVVECKSPKISNPMSEAITQMERYRNADGEKNGVEALFWSNQFLIATHGNKAIYSSITGKQDHFIEWKDSYPEAITDFKSIKRQNILIHGMLRKENLLGLIESFIFWHEFDNRKVKIVPRYQQFRAVDKIIKRLDSDTKPEDKHGIVWHTQGSGKSLTMMMTVRAMYRSDSLKDYKIVFLTDRRDLDKQLAETARAIGYKIYKSRSVSQFQTHLKRDSSDIVFGMIQKFQEHDLEGEFPILNDSKKILLLIDEAHRGQYSMLGANLRNALPNAVHIAFTGTPIEKTETTFGGYIDKYSMRQAVEDGVTLDIIYEGRTHNSSITDKEGMDQKFEDVFTGADEQQKQDILGRYTTRAYLEADEVIKDKAYDMIEHYVADVLPNGFKAQVVANSRKAAVLYKKHLDEAINEKLTSVKDPVVQKRLAKLAVGVIISGDEKKDTEELRKHTNESDHDELIESFKLGFEATGEGGSNGNVGILVVRSMLLTGFDAPIEQVMYLDTVIREHNLLQAIARVNRTYHNKNAGFLVDYVGVVHHLREALANFSDKDITEILGVLSNTDENITALIYAHGALLDYWKSAGVDHHNKEEAIWHLADDEARMEFMSFYRKFTRSLDRVLPNPKALEYEADLRYFSALAAEAKNTYRDQTINLAEAAHKIQSIVDEHLNSLGIDPKISPVEIFSEKFLLKEDGTEYNVKSEKVESKRLESAIREYITTHKDLDPELFKRLSEKLEEILQEYKDNWNELCKNLRGFIETAKKGREDEETYGFQRESELPFFHYFVSQVYPKKKTTDLNDKELNEILSVTKDILSQVRQAIQAVGFWESAVKQDQLRSHLIREYFILQFRGNVHVKNNKEKIIQEVMELAKTLHHKLL